ncbi:hypothetical protein OK016_10495 [Vibrio chagasii]|nr:hypothetical protein [Vibrio chagasii]
MKRNAAKDFNSMRFPVQYVNRPNPLVVSGWYAGPGGLCSGGCG